VPPIGVLALSPGFPSADAFTSGKDINNVSFYRSERKVRMLPNRKFGEDR